MRHWKVFAHGGRGDRGTPAQWKVVGGQPLRELSRGVEGPKGGEGGEGGGEPGSSRIVSGRGARNTEGSQPPPVAAIDINWWEAGFACEDRGGGLVEAVGDLSADPMPEGVH